MCDPEFLRLFESGRVIETDEFGSVVLSLHPAGRLSMPVGRIVIVESAGGLEAPLKGYPFPPGEHPVVLSIANFEGGRQWVAAAMVVAGKRLPARWLALVSPDEDQGEGELVPGFGATKLTVTLMDGEAYVRIATEELISERLVTQAADEVADRLVDDWSWANVVLDPATGLNVVLVATGVGDGLRGAYVGVDEEDECVALVVDFAIFGYEHLI